MRISTILYLLVCLSIVNFLLLMGRQNTQLFWNIMEVINEIDDVEVMTLKFKGFINLISLFPRSYKDFAYRGNHSVEKCYINVENRCYLFHERVNVEFHYDGIDIRNGRMTVSFYFDQNHDIVFGDIINDELVSYYFGNNYSTWF